jgi:MFS family permease
MFSWIALASPLGAIIGSLVVGQLVEWKGYPMMFTVMAAEYAIWPMIALLLREPEARLPRSNQSTLTAGASAGPNRAFHFLLASLFLSAMTISVNRMGSSLTMKELGYSAGAISGANVIGGLVTIPIVLWFGKLSDRLGRKMFLLSGYLLAALGGLTLVIGGNALWHYWLVAAVTLISRSISASLASALATDVLPTAALGRRLPWVSAVTWIAGIIGFAGSGVVIDLMGTASLFAIAAAMSLAALVFASPLPGAMPALGRWRFTSSAPINPAPCSGD